MDRAISASSLAPGALAPLSQTFRDAAALGALALWTLVWALPIWRIEGLDDAFYSEAAHLWTQGSPPYVGVFDIKPPGYFALLALAQMAFGPTLATLHGLSLVCDFLTAATILFIGRGLGAPRAGFAAAAMFLPLMLFFTENAAYPPLVLATSLAFAFALSAPGAAGMCSPAGSRISSQLGPGPP